MSCVTAAGAPNRSSPPNPHCPVESSLQTPDRISHAATDDRIQHAVETELQLQVFCSQGTLSVQKHIRQERCPYEENRACVGEQVATPDDECW